MFHLNNIRFMANKQIVLSIEDLKLSEKGPVLILGPSGCGKTTLLQIMAGIRKAQSGSVLFDDTNLQDLSGAERDKFRGRYFGFVFQNFHLLRHLNVADNIRLACMGAQIPANEDKIKTLLEQLDLSGKATQKAASLSQGEAQRVSIARAVVNDPQVIFADEPTSALDDTNTDRVMDLLEVQAKETGAQLIVATHDSRIKNRFDTVVTLGGGRIVT